MVSLLDHPVSILHSLIVNSATLQMILILMRNTSLALLYCPVELSSFSKLHESREVRRRGGCNSKNKCLAQSFF